MHLIANTAAYTVLILQKVSVMESARDKRTGEIVEAEDLWLLDKR